LLKKLYFITLILLASCIQDQRSGSVEMIVNMDTTYTTIGTPVFYLVNVKSPKDKIIKFSEWTLEEPLEIRSFSTRESETGQVGEFELVFWDTGKVSIPGVTILVLNSDSSFAYQITADSMDLDVVSITEQDPTLRQSSGGGIMPIKDPVPVKFPLPWKTIALFILLIIIFTSMVITWKKRLKSAVLYEDKPEYLQSPDIVALNKLDELEQSSLLDKREIKEFYARLSHILREYTENSLYIRALEMTTSEIQNHLTNFPYNDDQIQDYINILSGADMAKYAKHVAATDQCSLDISKSRLLVQETTQYWKLDSIS